MRVLHLAALPQWERALRTGSYDGSTHGRMLSEEGYVHASAASQLPIVVNGPVYAGVSLDDQVLLVIEAATCDEAGSTMRWEGLAGSQPFPHIFGPIPVEAVVAVLPVHRDEAGLLVMPDLTGLEVVEHPPTDHESADDGA